MTAPADITVECDALPAPSRIPFSNGLTGGCGISGTSNLSTFSTPTSTCNGTVTETWTAKDACGRDLAPVSRTIHIVDHTAPTITTCTSNKSVNANNAGCSYKQAGTTWDATATDNCSSTTIKYTLSGATTSNTNAYTTLNNVVFNGGTTTVRAIAYDACNNASGACTYNVTVTNSLMAKCGNTNPQLYFGYTGDQTSTISGTATGGTGPYTISITMNRPLKCNYINDAGDEKYTATGGTTTNGTCPASGSGTAAAPVSTITNVAAGVPYSVNVTLLANAVFTITVKDAKGCISTCTTTVSAEDVRCFAGSSSNQKYSICHRTGSSSNPCVTICVDKSAVNTHLAHGDVLGACPKTGCPAPATTTAMKSTSGTTNAADENAVKKLTVKVMANPSATHFTLMVKSPKNDRVSMRIMDLTGRVIEEKLSVAPNGTTQLGANYFPGMFIAEVIQGNERVSVKLIKTYR
ncbi:MAG: T9SS type A sorting domain-containing protein [Segetibacter sp.]